jgi:hypothetical protein
VFSETLTFVQFAGGALVLSTVPILNFRIRDHGRHLHAPARPHLPSDGRRLRGAAD